VPAPYRSLARILIRTNGLLALWVYLIQLERRYILRQLTLQPHRHVFTRGFQHRNDLLWVCPNSTHISFLGNQAAAEKWRAQVQHTLGEARWALTIPDVAWPTVASAFMNT
jgi:hypothetical protein